MQEKEGISGDVYSCILSYADAYIHPVAHWLGYIL